MISWAMVDGAREIQFYSLHADWKSEVFGGILVYCDMLLNELFIPTV